MNDVELLRIIADDYDQAQRGRVAKGEQIRAIIQGRDQQEGGGYLKILGFEDQLKKDDPEKVHKSAADFLLDAVLRDETNEPHPYLARAFRTSWDMERQAFKEMSVTLETHPVWPWMNAVRGVGPTIGAKLLARLDIDLAHNASSFWAYCGLTTVPGQRWECGTCGYVGIHPEDYEVTGKHKGCKALAEKTHGANDGIRAALPRAKKGEKRGYDAFAKKTCFLLASSWLKAGPKSFYNRVYREKVGYYERERAGWEKGRRHFSAMRVAEKLFLSHLYEAWCDAIGKEPGECYAQKYLMHDGIISANEVLEWEEAQKAAAA